MTADAWQVYDIFLEELGKEGHNLNGSDTIKVALLDSGYTPATATDEEFSTIDADELANGNGYTTGGATVATTWDAATGTLTFDGADPSWTASGAALVARYAVIYNSTKGSKDLIAYCLLNNTPGDVTAPDGTALTIGINASGVFTIAQ